MLLLVKCRFCRRCLWNRNAGSSAAVGTGGFAVHDCNGHAIAACSDAMRSTIAVPTSACVWKSHQVRIDVTNATLVTSSEVRTIEMCTVCDRNPEIAQDHAIHRHWSERCA